MQFFLNVWNRVRKFDPSKLTPMQIVVGIASFIVGLWVVAQVLSLILKVLTFLMIPALAVIVIYFAWGMMRSRSEDIPEEIKKTEQEKLVEDAVATVKAALSTENLGKGIEVEAAAVEDTAPEQFEEEDVPLAIAQVVNPETGFKEPDISRLIEHEEAKLKEADQVNEDIMAQIEARRKRLRGKDGE